MCCHWRRQNASLLALFVTVTMTATVIGCLSLSADARVAEPFVSPIDLFSIPQDRWPYPHCKVGNATGRCVFSLSCSHSQGRHLGLCRQGFYFGSCCQLEARKTEEEEDGFNEIEDSVCGVRSSVLFPPTSRRHSLYGDSPRFRFRSGSRRKSRIIGGRPSEFGAWPWQVALYARRHAAEKRTQNCGAVMISRLWVVTAAHCVERRVPDDLLLRFGDHDRSTSSSSSSSSSSPPRDYPAARIVSHPSYNRFTYDNDLALLRTARPVRLDEHIRPVCLLGVGRGLEYDGLMGYVTGWGAVYQDGPRPDVLQETSVNIYDHARCNAIFWQAGLNEQLTDVFICAGVDKGGKDACDGDSGGPLVIQSRKTKRWTLVGVISWGNGCGEVNQPGVYTNMQKFIGWIESII